MRKELTAWGGGVALVASAITIPATSAAAADYDIIKNISSDDVQTESTITWTIGDSADTICDDPEIMMLFDPGMPFEPQPDEIITIAGDDRSGEVDLALAADKDIFGFLFEIRCDENTYTGDLEFGQLNIEKQVIGTPYTSENFELEVTFEVDTKIFEDTAVFSSFGGTISYYHFDDGVWSFEETADGGADKVTISPEILEIDDEDDLGPNSVTVTNQFPLIVGVPVMSSGDFITTDGERAGEQSNTNYPPMCADGDISTHGYLVSEGEEVNVEPAFEVSVDDDGTTGTVDVANAPGSGYYTTEVACEDDGLTFIYTLNTAVDVFTLTKDVTGDAPADANFEIEVTASYPIDSEDGELEHGPNAQTLDFSFPATGGEQKVFHHTGEIWAYWTAEETDDGGADSVKIEERNYLTEDGDAFATITNVFESEDEEEPAPTPMKEDPTYAG